MISFVIFYTFAKVQINIELEFTVFYCQKNYADWPSYVFQINRPRDDWRIDACYYRDHHGSSDIEWL